MKLTRNGFSVIEIIIVIAIMSLLMGLAVSTFITYRKREAFNKDTETVTEILTQARAQTLQSKGGLQYGVHFATSQVTLFSGTAYATSTVSNSVYPLISTDLILNISLTGGGSDVIFKRLTGETDQNGTIVVDVPSLSQTKTVTIYKTGLIDSN
jgi:prepilin-type N-terminal cleavage/methylation domain-containing protein